MTPGWDKGEGQCHPASPCDGGDKAVRSASALEPLSSGSGTAVNVAAKSKREGGNC